MVTHSNLALDSIIGGLLAAEKADIASVSSPSLPPPPPIHTLRFGSRVCFFIFLSSLIMQLCI